MKGKVFKQTDLFDDMNHSLNASSARFAADPFSDHAVVLDATTDALPAPAATTTATASDFSTLDTIDDLMTNLSVKKNIMREDLVMSASANVISSLEGLTDQTNSLSLPSFSASMPPPPPDMLSPDMPSPDMPPPDVPPPPPDAPPPVNFDDDDYEGFTVMGEGPSTSPPPIPSEAPPP
eukprot:14442614-Ditylum_brightwellii.AAC.1